MCPNDLRRHAQLLRSEADRHSAMMSISRSPAVIEAHAEVIRALDACADLAEKEAKRQWIRCRKSASKKGLSLKPLIVGSPSTATTMSPEK